MYLFNLILNGGIVINFRDYYRIFLTNNSLILNTASFIKQNLISHYLLTTFDVFCNIQIRYSLKSYLLISLV